MLSLLNSYACLDLEEREVCLGVAPKATSLASVLKEMRDKIRSLSTKSKDEAVSDPKVDKPLSKGALEEAGLEREGDRLRERKITQEMEVDRTKD